MSETGQLATRSPAVPTGHPSDLNNPDDDESEDDRFPPHRGGNRDRGYDRDHDNRDRDRDERAMRERKARLCEERRKALEAEALVEEVLACTRKVNNTKGETDSSLALMYLKQYCTNLNDAMKALKR